MSTEDLWFDFDAGLIVCWERGREKAAEDPELAKQARHGELVPLPWKGGLEKALKTTSKFGTLRYLAMLQGLKGDDLSIDTEKEPFLVCTRFGVVVTFTGDIRKYGNA